MQDKELLEEILVELKVISKFISTTGLVLNEKLRILVEEQTEEEPYYYRDLHNEDTYLAEEESIRYTHEHKKQLAKEEIEEQLYKGK